jgi:hypothetical protein
MNSRNIDSVDSGALESSYRDSHDLEYQTNTFQEVPLASKVEDAGNLIQGARTVEGNEMRVGWEREQAIEHGVSKRPDERVDPDDQAMTTEVIERINGEQDEIERHFRNARRAQEADHDRAEACREDVSSMDRQYRTLGSLDDPDVSAVPASEADLDEDGVSQHQPVPEERPTVEGYSDDPWGELTQEQVGDVNQAAQQLYDELGDEAQLSRSSMSRLLAQRVAAGQDVFDALFALKDSILQFPDVCQPIADIDPFNQYMTTIEAEVDVLWSPKDDSQYQVGLLSDDSGETIKFVVWQKAGNKPILHEGDVVRINRGKVNAYKHQGNWASSIAVDSEAEIIHLEEGDGEGTRLRFQTSEPRKAPWDVESDTHAWLMQSDISQSEQ